MHFLYISKKNGTKNKVKAVTLHTKLKNLLDDNNIFHFNFKKVVLSKYQLRRGTSGVSGREVYHFFVC